MNLDELAEKAEAEGWRIQPPTLAQTPILAPTGETVGFFCLHAAGRGRWRVGPIYVSPEHRGQRLAEQAYARLTVPLVAYVHESNVASRRLHERCGFTFWYRTRGGEYWKRG